MTLNVKAFSGIKHDSGLKLSSRKRTHRGLNRQKESEDWPAIDSADKWLWRGQNKEMRGKRTGGHSQVAAWLPIQFSQKLMRK